MKHCDRCDVSIDSPAARCPLCYSTLRARDHHPETAKYPDLIQRAQSYNIVFRIMVFLSLTFGTVCLAINLFTFRTYWWSIIVIANILYLWIAIGSALRPTARLGQVVVMQAVSLSVLLVVLGYLMDFSATVYNYVLPAVLITATLSITVIAIVKRVDIQSFVLYFVIITLLGFVPGLLLMLGMVSVPWPSVVSSIYSGLSLASIFIFADHATKIELKKRFHL